MTRQPRSSVATGLQRRQYTRPHSRPYLASARDIETQSRCAYCAIMQPVALWGWFCTCIHGAAGERDLLHRGTRCAAAVPVKMSIQRCIPSSRSAWLTSTLYVLFAIAYIVNSFSLLHVSYSRTVQFHPPLWRCFGRCRCLRTSPAGHVLAPELGAIELPKMFRRVHHSNLRKSTRPKRIVVGYNHCCKPRAYIILENAVCFSLAGAFALALSIALSQSFTRPFTV